MKLGECCPLPKALKSEGILANRSRLLLNYPGLMVHLKLFLDYKFHSPRSITPCGSQTEIIVECWFIWLFSWVPSLSRAPSHLVSLFNTLERICDERIRYIATTKIRRKDKSRDWDRIWEEGTGQVGLGMPHLSVPSSAPLLFWIPTTVPTNSSLFVPPYFKFSIDMLPRSRPASALYTT